MKDLIIYTIKDNLAGSFGEPFVCPNDDVAKRRFSYLLTKSEMIAKDLVLYRVGSYDTETGNIYTLGVDIIQVADFSILGDAANNE